MEILSSIKKIIFINSYPPLHSNIATYTNDLQNAFSNAYPQITCSTMVISDFPEYDFPKDVVYIINKENIADYILGADFINFNEFDLVCVQHEFCMYGGKDGEALLKLLLPLKVPIITTLHTLICKPSGRQKFIIENLNRLSARLVVLTDNASDVLHKIHCVSISKIDTIPHSINDEQYQLKDHIPAQKKISPLMVQKYKDTFEKASQAYKSEISSVKRETIKNTPLTLPDFCFDHLRRMSDSTGVLQHAKYSFPDYSEGYCTDDNARALLLTLHLEQLHIATPFIEFLKSRTISFLNFAFNSKQGRFRNFMSFDRQWLDQEGSEDCHGRAIWALGTCVGQTQYKQIQSLAIKLFQKSLPPTLEFCTPRGWTFVLLGIHAYLLCFEGDRFCINIFYDLLDRLDQLFHRNSSNNWPWCEDYVTYDNGRIIQALLLGGMRAKRMDMVERALLGLRWLVNIQTSAEGYFRPIGSNGFYHRGAQAAIFDQQPIEACGMISACIEAFRVTREISWASAANTIFEWFFGKNEVGVPVYDSQNGGCNDAIQPGKVNENQGAESTLSFLLALAEMQLFYGDKRVIA